MGKALVVQFEEELFERILNLPELERIKELHNYHDEESSYREPYGKNKKSLVKIESATGFENQSGCRYFGSH